MADTRRLPKPNSDKWEWQLKGACRGMDSAHFFHPEGERGPARVDREARAKAVCQRCPVIEECRRHALAVQEPYGVWGGLSEAERDTCGRPDPPTRHRAASQAGPYVELATGPRWKAHTARGPDASRYPFGHSSLVCRERSGVTVPVSVGAGSSGSGMSTTALSVVSNIARSTRR